MLQPFLTMEGKFSLPIVIMELTRWTDKSLLDDAAAWFPGLLFGQFRSAETPRSCGTGGIRAIGHCYCLIAQCNQTFKHWAGGLDSAQRDKASLSVNLQHGMRRVC